MKAFYAFLEFADMFKVSVDIKTTVNTIKIPEVTKDRKIERFF